MAIDDQDSLSSEAMAVALFKRVTSQQCNHIGVTLKAQVHGCSISIIKNAWGETTAVVYISTSNL